MHDEADYFGYADTLITTQRKIRSETRHRWELERGSLGDAHGCVVNSIASMLSRSGNMDTPKNNHHRFHKRAAILAGVIQGIEVLETCISEGTYYQAAPLLRQNLEAVEALKEIRLNGSIVGNKPKLDSFKSMGFGRYYGHLSAITHSSDHDMIKLFTKPISERDQHHSTTFDPIYRSDVSKSMFSMNIFVLCGIAAEQNDLIECISGETMNQFEREQLQISLGILTETGFIKFNP